MDESLTFAFDLRSQLSDLFTDPQLTSWSVAMAIVMLVVGWVGGRLARRGMTNALRSIAGLSENAKVLVARFVQYLTWAIAVGVALTFLGAPIQPLLAAAIVVGAILALALRGVADNFAAGVVLQTRQPIQIGDDIDSLGHSGMVREITGRSVVIVTADGELVHLPNKKVLESPLVNNSANRARRSEIEVRAVTTDVDQVVEIVGEVVDAAADVVHDPAPTTYVTSIDGRSVVLVVRVWHAPGAARAVASAVCRGIFGALEDRSIESAVASPPPAPAPVTRPPS